MFEGRAGAKARAVFATEKQARLFAEQHALVTVTGMPLKWNDTADPMVLTTPVGDYRIARTEEDQLTRAAQGALTLNGHGRRTMQMQVTSPDVWALDELWAL